MANDTFNGSTPQEAADEIFGVINVVSGVAYNSEERTLSGVVDDQADDQYLKVGWNGFYTEGIKCDIDSAETRAIASANQYTDMAIANITGISIEGLSGASGVAYSSTNKMISGRVDNVAQQGEGGYLKVGGGGFYVSGVKEAIDAAKQEAINKSTGAISAKNGVEITEQDGVKTAKGVVDSNKPEKFLNVGSGGFYVSGVTGAIETAKQQAISSANQYTDERVDQAITGSIANLSATGGVAFNISNNTFSGVVDTTKNSDGFLNVGSGGFYTAGITGAIDNAFSASTAYTHDEITNLQENVNSAITDINEKIDAISGETSGMEDTAVTYSVLTAANEQRPILVKNDTGGTSGTGDVQFTTGLTVNNAGDLSGHSISAQTLVVTSGITANSLTTSSITYNGTALTEYIENTVTSITEDHDEKVEQVRYTGTAAKPVIVNTNGAGNTGAVGFVSAVTVDGNGGLSAVSASINNITSTSITATNLSANNVSATTITYNGQSLEQYISQTADDKNVSQTSFTGQGSAYMVLHTGTSDSTGSVSYVTGVSSDNAGHLKSVSVSAGTIEGVTVTGATVLGNTIKSGDTGPSESGPAAVDLSDLFVGTGTTISGTGYLQGGGTLSSSRTITHKELHGATGQTNPNTAQRPSFGGTFNIPVVAYDMAGHISSVSTTTVQLPTPSASSDSAVTQTSFTGTGSAYMVLHDGTSSSTTGVSYVTGVSSDNAGHLKSVSLSAESITVTPVAGVGTTSAQTAVMVNGAVEATKFVGIIDCGTYSGSTGN